MALSSSTIKFGDRTPIRDFPNHSKFRDVSAQLFRDAAATSSRPLSKKSRCETRGKLLYGMLQQWEMRRRRVRRWSPIKRANYDIKTRACRLLVEQSFAGESTTDVTQFVTRQSDFLSREEKIVFHEKSISTTLISWHLTRDGGAFTARSIEKSS